MFDVKVTQQDLEFAIETVNQKNFGQRGQFDGNRDNQITGILGEAVLYRLLKQDYPDYKNFSLVDLQINRLTVDAKNMKRKVAMKDHYVHNFVGYQKDFKVDILLFSSWNCSGFPGTLQICGWLPKDEFLKHANFYNVGDIRTRDDGTTFTTRAPLFEIENSKLNPIDSLEDLKNINLK